MQEFSGENAAENLALPDALTPGVVTTTEMADRHGLSRRRRQRHEKRL